MNTKKVAAFALGPIGAAGISLITLPIVAWLFSPQDIGRLTMLNVTISFSILLFSLGLDQAYVREYHEVNSKPSLLKAAFIPGFSLLLVSLLALTLSSYSPSMLLFGKESPFISFLLYGSIILAFSSRFLSLILRMQSRGLAFSMSQILPKLLFILIILGYVFYNVDAVFDKLITANFLSVTAVFIIFSWNTRRDWLPALTSKINRSEQLKMMKYSLPLIGSGLAFWGLTATDKVFLRSLSTFEELGIYSLSVSFAGAALVFQAIFSTVWAPIVYRWASEGVDPQRIKGVIDYVTLAVIVIWSLAGVFSWLVIYILPVEYQSVQYILLAAMGYPLLYTLSEASSVGIGIKRKTIFSLLAAISSLIINVILNWFLIPIYGAAGAAVGSAIAFFIFFTIRTEASSIIWKSFERLRMYSFVLFLVILSIIANTVNVGSILIPIYIATLFMGAFFFKMQSKKTFGSILIYVRDKANTAGR